MQNTICYVRRKCALKMTQSATLTEMTIFHIVFLHQQYSNASLLENVAVNHQSASDISCTKFCKCTVRYSTNTKSIKFLIMKLTVGNVDACRNITTRKCKDIE